MASQSIDGMALETLVGPLAKKFSQLVRGTILHADQLTNERRTAEDPLRAELRNQMFYTADSPLCTVEDGEGILYLGRNKVNPVFNNLVEAALQLIATGHYIPPKADMEALINAEDTLRVRLSDLGLQETISEWSYFEIDTADYNGLNEHQRTVAERVYGQGNDFIENMKMHNDVGIMKIRIYILNPDYVKNNVPQGGALAWASRLVGFPNDSRFDAICDVDNDSGLRGVVDVTKGNIPKVRECPPISQDYGATFAPVNKQG